MQNATDQFTKNKFVDKVMSYLPDDPLTQAKFMYYLTIFVFLGLLGYAAASWVNTFTYFKFTTLFSSVFMTAIALMTTIGLKQARISYHMIKEMYSNKEKQKEVATINEMLEEFKDAQTKV